METLTSRQTRKAAHNSTYPKGGVSCSKDSFEARKAMEKAAKDLDFLQAAKYRDEIKVLQEKI